MLMNLALYFWCSAFALVTFDRVLVFSFHHFIVKAYHFLFLAAFFCLLLQEKGFSKKYLSLFKRFFITSLWLPMLFMTLYATLGAPFSVVPVKSLAYALRGWFDIFLIVGAGYIIFSEKKEFAMQVLLRVLAFSVCFQSLIICIDHIAYFYGHTGGLLGYNQDSTVHWGLSRPHAFSYEPSYLSTFFSIALLFFVGDAIFFQKKFLSRWASYVSIALTSMALFLLASRTGWVAAFLEIVLFLSWARVLWKRLLAYLPRFLIGAVIVMTPFFILTPFAQYQKTYDHYVKSIFIKYDEPGFARIHSMMTGVRLASHTHFIGTGLGASYAYWVFHPEFLSYEAAPPLGSQTKEDFYKERAAFYQQSLQTEAGGHAEVIMSIWCQVLAELGVFGLLLQLVFAYQLIKKLFLRAKQGSDALAWTAFVSCSIFFFFSAHWLGNPYRPDIWVWVALWAILSEPIVNSNAFQV